MHFRTLILALTISTLFGTGCQLKTTEDKSEEGETVSERDQMEKAMEQEFTMTVDPKLGYIPKERLIAALNYEKRLMALRGSGVNAFTWQERGPNNIAGRTRAVLIDSRDATGNTVFAASVSGGIWKATNFKTSTNPTWTPVNESMGSLAVCALAQDPSNPNIIYAGTGEGWFNSDAVRGNGIWKSSDGGNSWNRLLSTDSTTSSKAHNFDFVQDIVVNSQGVVFASCRSIYCNAGGVFRSSDGGVTWARVIGTQTGSCSTSINLQGTDLEIASNGDVYACTGMTNDFPSQNGHIFRSPASNGSNVGNLGTWTDITPAGTWQRIEIAVAPSNPAVIYALLEGTGDGIGAVKKSADFGANWAPLPNPDWCNQGAQHQTDFTNGQAFYDLIAQVDPNNENTVVVGGIDLFRSTDGGATWPQITQWARNCGSLPVVHADQHNFLFFPGSSSQVIATNDGGIYYSGNAGASWVTHTIPNLNNANLTTISDKNVGYNVTQFYACDIHPTQTNYMLAGCQDNGSLQFTTAGMNSVTEVSVGGDGGYSHIDQLNPNIQVVFSAYNTIYYSRNGGTSFSSSLKFNDNGQFINPSDYDDVKKIIYSGYIAGQLGVISNMASGTPTFSGVVVTGMSGLKVTAVKVDPTVSAGGTVWFAAYDSTRASSPTIFKMTNVSSGTPVVTTQLTAVPGGSYVSSIDVDPANANHILLTLSNYGIASVFESTNGGVSFSNVEGNLPDVPVRWGMFVPASASIDGSTPGGILIATEVGVWSTLVTGGAATVWLPQNGNLPNVRTDMLRFRGSDGLLAAATHGRGLFTTNLTLLSTGLPSVPNTKSFIDYVTNTEEQAFVKVGNLTTTSMQIKMYSMDGKLVYSSKTAYANQSISISRLARGAYVLKIYGNKNEQYTKQFIK